MIVKPRIRGFVCTTAHPAGCVAGVNEQIDLVRGRGAIEAPNRPRNALVIGCSGGFGLASRIVAGFGARANTLGISFEKQPTAKRTATAGWYNNLAFEAAAAEAGLLARTLDGDAFSDEMRTRTAEALKGEFGPIDLLVYSLAAPVRTHPRTGETHRSAIKPLGGSFTTNTLDFNTGKVHEVTLEGASEEETAATVQVMGGEDWEYWIDALADAGLLNEGFQTVAYTYLGSELTHRIYRGGTLGQAKADLDRAAGAIDARLGAIGGRARVAALTAIVSQASAAIPVVPLYVAILFRVMRERGVHESCIEHVDRLFRTGLYGTGAAIDTEGRLRLDDRELDAAVQAEVGRRWRQVNTESLAELGDAASFRDGFLKVFGFGMAGVNYDADVDIGGV
ncbi:MAG: trans-2-enoyl-CoA reductase family protein [Gammaproteobacteria bacterium]|nr:trans-2-enoyl-CoA reductase family protein [Gammaproteobacteria bacterium]MYB37641.1 trans-2-enoyl-CoA reductase family protein [Gammaproteobacteria bacterium]